MSESSTNDQKRGERGVLDQVVLAEVFAALLGMLVGLVVLARLNAAATNVEPAVVVVYLTATTPAASSDHRITLGSETLSFDLPNPNIEGGLIAVPIGDETHVDVARKDLGQNEQGHSRMEWVLTFQFKQPDSTVPVEWQIVTEPPEANATLTASIQAGTRPLETWAKTGTLPAQQEFIVRPERVEFGPGFEKQP